MIWLNRANKWTASPKRKTHGSKKKVLGKRDSGKLKVSEEKHNPSMKDIHPKK